MRRSRWRFRLAVGADSVVDPVHRQGQGLERRIGAVIAGKGRIAKRRAGQRALRRLRHRHADQVRRPLRVNRPLGGVGVDERKQRQDERLLFRDQPGVTLRIAEIRPGGIPHATGEILRVAIVHGCRQHGHQRLVHRIGRRGPGPKPRQVIGRDPKTRVGRDRRRNSKRSGAALRRERKCQDRRGQKRGSESCLHTAAKLSRFG